MKCPSLHTASKSIRIENTVLHAFFLHLENTVQDGVLLFRLEIGFLVNAARRKGGSQTRPYEDTVLDG